MYAIDPPATKLALRGGTFFRVMLMADERFKEPVLFVSGLSKEQLDANQRLLVEERLPDIFKNQLILPTRTQSTAAEAA